MANHSGSCSCGAVRYELTAEPIIVHACHCRDCQKQTGGAFAINAVIEASNVKVLQGAPEAVEMTTESGRPHDIYRCPECRVALWSDYGRRRTIYFIRVATLDDPAALPPDVHIYTRSKLPYVGLPEGADVFEGFYNPREYWSEEAAARWAAATEAS
ncbi:MAG: GFA family protein [Maricaulaceae bacterium]|jgi:hypothetical protein